MKTTITEMKNTLDKLKQITKEQHPIITAKRKKE